MKEIIITSAVQGEKIVYVDDEDYPLIEPYNWWLVFGCGTLYAMAQIAQIQKKRIRVLMHRFIVENRGYYLSGKQIDHIDGNGLNNCFSNLRICTSQQNHHNRHSRVGISKFKGVWWNKDKQKWNASIWINGKKKHLGIFADERMAAMAYDIAARQHFGDFANLNFKEEDENRPKRGLVI